MEKTIAVRLKGGLGNQLFQYAAGRSLAKSWNRDLVLLTDFLQRPAGEYTARVFELEPFGLQHLLLDEQRQKKLTENSFLKKIGLVKKPQIISEENFFTAVDSGQPVILDGYFQSEKFFTAIRPLLVKELKSSFKGEPGFNQQRSIMENHNSVAIHVRRGDYIHLPSAAQFHGALSMDYFNKAIGLIKQHERNLRFFVFSDDINWCRQNFPATDDFVFQTTSFVNSGTDLMLMSYCKFQVISNSSYSWWAAWLNENPEKRVIAPVNWFRDVMANNNDIYCNGWIRL